MDGWKMFFFPNIFQGGKLLVSGRVRLKNIFDYQAPLMIWVWWLSKVNFFENLAEQDPKPPIHLVEFGGLFRYMLWYVYKLGAPTKPYKWSEIGVAPINGLQNEWVWG